MKALKTLVAIALSATGLGSAVTLGVVANNNNEKIEQVEAAGEVRLYLDMSGFADWYKDSASFKVHTWNSAKGDQYHSVTKVSDAYYYADVDLTTYASGGGYRFTRYNSTGASEWNRGEWKSYSAGSGTYYRATGYTAGTWSEHDQKTWTVVGATNGVWAGGDEDISIPLTFRFNNEGLSFYNTTVELTAGSVFKVKDSDGNYYGYNAIETGSGSVISTGDVSGSGTSNIEVVNSGSYEIYMKPFSGKFWMQENSEATATAWASSFLSDTNSICSNGGTSANHLSALQAVWSDIKDGFDALTLGARNIIKTGTANATVADAHDRYVHIMTRYAGELDAFEDWEVSASRNMMLLANDSNAIVIITIVSVISLSAVGAFFLLRKKRKEQ
ncbi:MAG: hypothetical protein J5511_03160 [Bacilli bacterium]|nr:hypothetical protein [Bacilli bacterium]